MTNALFLCFSWVGCLLPAAASKHAQVPEGLSVLGSFFAHRPDSVKGSA